MTNDEILQAAKEAGFFFHDAGYAPIMHTLAEKYSQMCFERFAAIIEKRTIEKCAVVAEKECQEFFDGYQYITPSCYDISAAIRKLGEQ